MWGGMGGGEGVVVNDEKNLGEQKKILMFE